MGEEGDGEEGGPRLPVGRSMWGGWNIEAVSEAIKSEAVSNGSPMCVSVSVCVCWRSSDKETHLAAKSLPTIRTQKH